MKRMLAWTLILFCGSSVSAQYGDIGDFKLLKPEDKEHVVSKAPPEGAIVLFDGKTVDGWVQRNKPKEKAHWKVVDGFLQVEKGGDIHTEKTFEGKFHLHIEFRVPFEPGNKGQGRGNSGVYLQGRYEVQVLDSYGLDSKEGDCGGIYGIAKPLKNVCKAPTIWQSYDIEFEAPKFVDGKKAEPGIISVTHNGEKIHDKVVLTKDVTTSGMATDPSTPGPILLQDHGHPVQYRNIWLLPKK